jgi:hypothetical protein
LVSNG